MSYVGWPNFPQFEIGLTIPHTVKGIDVYVSPRDAEFSRHLMWTIIVSAAMTTICLSVSGELNKMPNRRRKPPLAAANIYVANATRPITIA